MKDVFYTCHMQSILEDYNTLTKEYNEAIDEIFNQACKDLNIIVGNELEIEVKGKVMTLKIIEIMPAISRGQQAKVPYDFVIRLICRIYNKKGRLTRRKIVISIFDQKTAKRFNETNG